MVYEADHWMEIYLRNRLTNALIENKEQTIRECDALKQSILRQAFSGEL